MLLFIFSSITPIVFSNNIKTSDKNNPSLTSYNFKESIDSSKIIESWIEPNDGYILFNPEYGFFTYLINSKGRVVHKWRSRYTQSLPVHLLENGNLIRSSGKVLDSRIWLGGSGGRIEIFNWDGDLLWTFNYMNDTHCLHNDIEPLPNGNILMIVWEKISIDDLIEAGINPDDPFLEEFGGLLFDAIIEVKPIGSDDFEIVWEWHLFDHLIQDFDPTKDNYGVVAEHPELVDINVDRLKVDVAHLNSIDYVEEFDQLLVSSRNLGEILILDHSTTTEEAAGHTGGNYSKGGDLLYRWGNPRSYDMGDVDDQILYGQHDPRWISKDVYGEVHITIFNNGFNRPEEEYSTVIEIIPPVDSNGNYTKVPDEPYGPEDPIWTYQSNNPFTNSRLTSSAQRLPNGNTLICAGINGFFYEVTPEKKVDWRYFNFRPLPIPGINMVFKTEFYKNDYPGIGNLSIDPTYK